MKRRDLEQHLRDHDCERVRHGRRHDVWHNPMNDRESTVPRHREIANPTARAICRQLDIPVPRGI
ncbi:MAG: type II toxin-antitoxin system HicA family toxin [Phycisphaerales bacterium]|nr:type II toxin-antitoxin system HicA family toxin [Phycisphaerales bacterium]